MVVETGKASEVLWAPRHPYTAGLLRSSPDLDDESLRLEPIPGQPPDLLNPAPGCPFAERCGLASAECRHEAVRMREVAPGHHSACLFPERLS
jgi:oligopeptide/dipeptide ABC transporter ATP-binding protein